VNGCWGLCSARMRMGAVFLRDSSSRSRLQMEGRQIAFPDLLVLSDYELLRASTVLKIHRLPSPRIQTLSS
jgi:hypothetical protein